MQGEKNQTYTAVSIAVLKRTGLYIGKYALPQSGGGGGVDKYKIM